ncbi:MAG: hypothetical protein IPL59_13765, partial [Candidatus Competibacteraceae bacterium]|nr:hypothetical protein [Candidatus Competibacteraceae bacterium]
MRWMANTACKPLKARQEAEFRKRRAAALNDQRLIASRLSQHLRPKFGEDLGQPIGDSRRGQGRRKGVAHHWRKQTGEGDAITLWVRDGFSAPEAPV